MIEEYKNNQFFFKINFSKISCKSELYTKGTEKLIKYGFIDQIGPGLFTYLPKGIRVLNKLCALIRKVFNKIGCQEVLFPTLHPSYFWEKSGRLSGAYHNEKLIINDRNNKQLIYGPTAEELAHDLAHRYIISERTLPCMFYNIQWKFRDEIRPKNGIMRSREFLMFDGYSFHTPEQTDHQFNIVKEACLQVFQELSTKDMPLDCISSKTSESEDIGGDENYEIIISHPQGEGEYKNEYGQICKGIEVGHIFKLNDTYPSKMQLNFKFPIHSSCFGLGVSRILGTFAEIGTDAMIAIPKVIAPYQLAIIPFNHSKVDEIKKINFSDEIYFDDRYLSVSTKCEDAFNSGIPAFCIIGDRELREKKVNIRYIDKERIVSLAQLLKLEIE